MKTKIIDFFKRNFDQELKKLPKKILVAVSGGADSMALAFLLKDFCDKFNIELFAVTVDHKMREKSTDEANEVAKILAKNQINHHILEIQKQDLPQKNIEAKLREQRYNLLYDFAIENNISSVFVGHHKNDLAENFIIRLFRGSQIDGISAMNEVFEFKKVKIYRPLLKIKKQNLYDFLELKKISWFEDESNFDEKFLRNKIRKFFDDFHEKDLIIDRIEKFSEVLKESRDFENQILLEQAQEILIFVKNGSFLIDFEKYKKLRFNSNSKQNIILKILSLVLLEISGQIYKPRLENLKNFERDLLNLQKGKKRNFYGCFAMILSKNKLSEISDFIDKNDFYKIKENCEKYILIYQENNNKSEKIEKFDQDFDLVNSRFLINKNGEKKFYFRSILKKIFE